MKTQCRNWAIVAITLLSLLATPARALDGFEAFSPRELARALGIGCGPGYHTKPCPTYLAQEHNRMLAGSRNPGCLAIHRAKMATKVPYEGGQYYFPNEDGNPSCQTCCGSPAWRTPNNGSTDLPTTTQVAPETIPAGDEDESDDGVGEESSAVGPPASPFDAPRLDLPQPEDNRSIEELLEIIQEEDRSTTSRFVPGQKLPRRLNTENEQLLQQQFPSQLTAQ